MFLSEAKASYSHKIWTEVSFSVLHLLQMGLLPSPTMHKCLLKVLCRVSRPTTTLVWVLLKDNSQVPVARLGPKINSRVCLCMLQGPCHNARCCFLIQWFNFLLIFCLETPKKGSGPTNRWAEPLLASLSATAFPLTPAGNRGYLLSVMVHRRNPNGSVKWRYTIPNKIFRWRWKSTNLSTPTPLLPTSGGSC